MNNQEKFWRSEFGAQYATRNRSFDEKIQLQAWNRMLNKIINQKINSILECGCNIGRNLITLKKILPKAKVSLIEINEKSYKLAVKNVHPEKSFNTSIVGSNFKDHSFDLVFTSGVLIHIAPFDLYRNMEKIFNYSKKHILFAEYFSRSLEMKIYHGEANKLFKMDFGSYFLDNFATKVIDYGFLWGREYDAGGFDDITWWLFEKD